MRKLITAGMCLAMGVATASAQTPSIFQPPCDLESRLAIVPTGQDFGLRAVYTDARLSNGNNVNIPFIGRFHGCVSTQVEKDQLMYGAARDGAFLIRFMRTMPSKDCGLAGIQGQNLSGVYTHVMTSNFYDSVKAPAKAWDTRGQRLYGRPWLFGMIPARRCALAHPVECAANPELTQDLQDALDIHVEDGQCVEGASYVTQEPLEEVSTIKGLLGMASGRITFPAPDGPDLEALMDTHHAHMEVLKYELAYADWFDGGEVGPPPAPIVNRVQATHRVYEALVPSFVDRKGLVGTVVNGKKPTRDEWILWNLYYRKMLPFGGIDPTWTPDEVASWSILTHEAHGKWVEAQKTDAHFNQWEENRDIDKTHAHLHLMKALKDPEVVIRPLCGEGITLASCPTFTGPEYLQFRAADLVEMKVEAREHVAAE